MFVYKFGLLFGSVAAVLCLVNPAVAQLFGIARSATPVLNSAAFAAIFGGSDGKTLKADICGQVRELEYIALPGTVFTVEGKVQTASGDVYQVRTVEYPAAAQVRLYVDGRFLAFSKEKPLPRKKTLPAAAEIQKQLREMLGQPYVWGGDVPQGVTELTALFYGGRPLGRSAALTLAGLDCSGLLYHATGGWTPRNTSELLNFGHPVAIAGKSSADIAALLQPLDLIVWSGHVIIVLDRTTAIESRLECAAPGHGGVVKTPLPQRVAEVMRTKQPLDNWPQGALKRKDVFVVRRWYPSAL
jgi:hypothetical protein